MRLGPQDQNIIFAGFYAILIIYRLMGIMRLPNNVIASERLTLKTDTFKAISTNLETLMILKSHQEVTATTI